uniref:Uncharacterized protein n=1 Tax=Ditylenchus dipsaci TaxID=166011 RepID=A0A915EB15_9BILA
MAFDFVLNNLIQTIVTIALFLLAKYFYDFFTCHKVHSKKVPIIKVDWKKDVVYLFQFPRPKCTANMSPFCLKLETFLRHHNIDHEIMETMYFKIQDDLSEEQKGVVRTIDRMLDSGTFYNIYYYKGGTNPVQFAEAILDGQAPKFLKWFFVLLSYPKVWSTLNTVGTGRFSDDEVRQILHNDLLALDQILGDKQWLVADQPSLADFTFFSHAASSYNLPYHTPLQYFLDESFPRLRNLHDRIAKKNNKKVKKRRQQKDDDSPEGADDGPEKLENVSDSDEDDEEQEGVQDENMEDTKDDQKKDEKEEFIEELKEEEEEKKKRSKKNMLKEEKEKKEKEEKSRSDAEDSAEGEMKIKMTEINMDRKSCHVLPIFALSLALTFIYSFYAFEKTEAGEASYLSLDEPKAFNQNNLVGFQFYSVRVKRAGAAPKKPAKGGARPSNKAAKGKDKAAAKGAKKPGKKNSVDKIAKGDGKTKKTKDVKKKPKKNSDDSDDLNESDEGLEKNKKEKNSDESSGPSKSSSGMESERNSRSREREGNADLLRDRDVSSSSSDSSPTSSSSDDSEEDDIFGGGRGGPPNGFNPNGMGGNGADYVVNSITTQAKQPADVIDQCAKYVHDCTADEFQPFMNANCRGTCEKLGLDGRDVGQNCIKIQQLCFVDAYIKDMQKFCVETCHPELRLNSPGQFGGNTMQSGFPQPSLGFRNSPMRGTGNMNSNGRTIDDILNNRRNY